MSNKSPALTERKKKVFLQILSETGQITRAAHAAGYADSSYLRKLYKNDEAFAEAWEEAITAASDVLESEAVRRAVDGINEPVYYQGELVDVNTKYSDGLLQFLLKGAKPEVYRDNVNLSGAITGGIAIVPVAIKSEDDWERAALDLRDNEVIDAAPAIPASKENVK